MNIKLFAVGAAVAGLALVGCSTTDSTDTSSSPTPTVSESPAMTEPGTVVDVAAGNEDFSTLVQAVQAAGLESTLAGDGPFTVFAPTNAAFEALPEGLLDKLLLPENKETLTKILTYHVLPVEVMAADVEPGKVATVEGSKVTITVKDGKVMVDEANVTATDVDASNGVIHVIDAVLVPQDVDVSAL